MQVTTAEPAAFDWTEEDRLRAFGAELDALRRRVEGQIGDVDLAYIRKVRRFSRAMEIAGRTLLHVSVEPIGFTAGVTALWLHKQVEATEIGHTALHGAFDKIDGAGEFQSKSFRWHTPIDEASWRYSHNVRHHQYTNVAGRDPDIHFGPIRWNQQTPYDPGRHRGQLWKALLLAGHFASGINVRDSGLADHLSDNGRPEKYDFIDERTPASRRQAVRALLRKFVPYYGREMVLYPALAGPLFWKVLLGNLLSELMRDVYSAATIFCGHVGDDIADYPAGTRAGSRHRWYAMQVEATSNFEVPLPVSILCGALDRQIEHHLFPRFPTNRLREIAPEVRDICRRYGVRYTTDSWPGRLRKVAARLRQLSRPDAEQSQVGASRATNAA